MCGVCECACDVAGTTSDERDMRRVNVCVGRGCMRIGDVLAFPMVRRAANDWRADQLRITAPKHARRVHKCVPITSNLANDSQHGHPQMCAYDVRLNVRI